MSVILSTLIVFLTRADKHGVKVVKHIKGGLNPSSVHQLQFTGPHIGEIAKIGLIVAIIALTVCVQFLNLILQKHTETQYFLLLTVLYYVKFRKPLQLAGLLHP